MAVNWTEYQKELIKFLPSTNVDTPSLEKEIKSLFEYFFLLLFNNLYNRQTLINHLSSHCEDRGWIDRIHKEQMQCMAVPLHESSYSSNIYVENEQGTTIIIYLEHKFKLTNQMWAKLNHRFTKNQQQIVNLLLRYNLIQWQMSYAIPKRCIKRISRDLKINTEAYASPLDYSLPVYYTLFKEDEICGAKHGDWTLDPNTRFLVHPPWHQKIVEQVLLKIKSRFEMNVPTTILLVVPNDIMNLTIPGVKYKSSVVLPANSYELYRPFRDSLMRINHPLFIGLLSNEPDLSFDCTVFADILKYTPRQKQIPLNRSFQTDNLSSRMRVGTMMNIPNKI